jgi:predicted Ser/Thr protein kinase
MQPWLREMGYHGFALSDRDGRLLGSDTPQWIGQRLPAAQVALLQKVFAGNPVVATPFESTLPLFDASGQPHPPTPLMFFGAPVRGRDGNVVACLGMGVCAMADFTRTLTTGRFGEMGESYAFDASGTILSRLRNDEELKAIGLLPDRPEALSALNIQMRDPGIDLTQGRRNTTPRSQQPLTRAGAAATAAARGEAPLRGIDVDGYRDHRGVTVAGAWNWLPHAGFGIAIEWDTREAFEALSTLRVAFGGLFGLFALAALGTAFAMHFRAKLQHRLDRTMRQMRRLGQYQLEEKIGEGGMGEVYRAQHALLRRPTAVKLLRPSRTSETDIKRFEREVQLTSMLTHPNTIAVYDYGRTVDGVFYYAMEYLDGLDLNQVVRTSGPLPEARVLHVLRQICRSLDEAHAHGLIHRDIKPANLFLCRRGGIDDFVKVVDFGLVRDVRGRAGMTLTQADMVAGTPQYMAPETVRNPDKVDARTDLYAVGAVGYFLLTGVAPHDGAESDWLDVLLHEAPPSPSQRLGRRVAPDVESLILRCLAKEPSQRPQSARALLDAIDACADANRWSEGDATRWWREHSTLRKVSDATPTLAVTQELAIDVGDSRIA